MIAIIAIFLAVAAPRAVTLVPMNDPIVGNDPKALSVALNSDAVRREQWWVDAKTPVGAGNPGYGWPGRIESYEPSEELKGLMADYPGLEAYWYHRERVPAYEPCVSQLRAGGHYDDSVPFLLYRPRMDPWYRFWRPSEVPLVIYMPGCGEQGKDLALQFSQVACLKKVTSETFQNEHPCWLLIPMPPIRANYNIPFGYPAEPRAPLITLFNDLVLKLVDEMPGTNSANAAKVPRIDRSRLYLTGLGSGATLAAVMAFDHPGRYAAVMPIWSSPDVPPAVCPEAPGNWWYAWEEGVYGRVKSVRDRLESFAADVRMWGGEFEIHTFPKRSPGWWWDAAWESDELWDWCFDKESEKEVERDR